MLGALPLTLAVPLRVNDRWACAFMRSSNCSLPSAIADCTSNFCNDYTNTWLSTLLDSASVEGQLVNPLHRELISGLGQQPTGEGPAQALRDYRVLPPFLSQPPALPQHQWLAFPNTSLDNDPLPSDPAAALFASFLLRLTFLYRARTARQSRTSLRPATAAGLRGSPPAPW